MIIMETVNRDWDELACPECGALNVVIIGTKQQIEGRCNERGKGSVFTYSHTWRTVEHVVERTRERRGGNSIDLVREGQIDRGIE
jgi:hypothetical protein